MGHGFLIDTNVISELMRDQPHPDVVAWFAHHADRRMHTSAVNEAEILTGIALLPAGKRRNLLAQAAQTLFEQDLAERCLPFDGAAAQQYALIRAHRHQSGHPISTEDAQIAAIAVVHQLAVVTRNTKDFARIPGLRVINPWSSHKPLGSKQFGADSN